MKNKTPHLTLRYGVDHYYSVADALLPGKEQDGQMK